MKKKLLSITALCLMLHHPVAFADDADKVQPNVYEKRDVQVNSRFQDEQKHKEELPEAQKQLTFEIPKQTKKDLLKEQLFQTSVIQSNSISAKTSQMGLFEETSLHAMQKEEATQQNGAISKMLILLLITTAVVIGLIFLLVLGARRQTNLNYSK